MAETARPTQPPSPTEAWRYTAAHAARTTFFFDFDGVLSPVTDDPDASQPVESVLGVLEQLAAKVHRVAIGSARPVSFLRSRFDSLSHVDLYGLYGLEVWHDGKVVTGQSRLLLAGVDEAAIYTPKMGWMLLAEFLDRQGVLEASRWLVLGARISGAGKTLVGTAFPLAADYYHGFRLDLDQVFVCHGNGSRGKTLRVGFPDAMDQHLSHRDTVGFCPGQGPL